MAQETEIFRILTSPTRRSIIKELQRQPRYVTELARLLNKPQSTISNQLKALTALGIICRQDDAKSIGEYHIFALEPQARKYLRGIIDLAEKMCA